MGKISLAQGRSFSDQELENGEDVCIIPDDLVVVQKELNRPVLKEISVGDHITVSEIMNSNAPDGSLDLKRILLSASMKSTGFTKIALWE